MSNAPSRSTGRADTDDRDAGWLRIEVAYSPVPDTVDLTDLRLPPGASVADALAASGVTERHPLPDWSTVPLGIWGRPVERERRLADGDRVEVYRPLRVDPKEARRERYRAQRAKPAAPRVKRSGR